jgi:2-polyprenyl-3-methyl-5-hydroxy-6-metoxy-1,4-benzoquinol methylase
VLDLGCGTGAWLERLARAGFVDLAGVDADGSQFGAGAARMVVADLDRDSLPLPERHYALITAIEVIEHLECVGHFLSLVERHLAADGIVLLTTPNVHALRARLRFMVTGRLPAFDEKGEPTHLAPLFVPLLERMLDHHGLRVAELWTFPERGSVLFRPGIRAVSAMLRTVLPDPLPGDVLCVRIQRLAGREDSGG